MGSTPSRRAGAGLRPGTRLAAADEANLTLDHAGQVNVFLIAGLLGPGGFLSARGIPDMDLLRRAVSTRIATLPALRRVAVPVGRRHMWTDVAPDLDHHVRLAPAVEGLAGLERVCAALMDTPLPMDRPLWELLIVPGASADRNGMVLRIHHAIADGIAAVAIVRQLFEESAPVPSVPRPEHGRSPETSLGTPLSAARRWRGNLHRIRVTFIHRRAGRTVLLGRRSATHGVELVDCDLANLASHARTVGATVNDALLCAVAAGYRALLPAVGEPVPDWLTVSVPVGLRRRDRSANQVGVMLVRLPLSEPDTDRRLRLIALQTTRDKPQARALGTLELMRGPIGARIMDGFGRHQRLVAGFVTDVPGPSGMLRLGGAPVAAIWPVAVLAANVRCGVAAVSYAGRLSCGIHFDAAHIPGAAFATGMRQAFAELSA
ncbi:wax ester/triacylglycerol synthase domain-containing protein [Microbacterium sulfonylureivorans]|uniref:wax ester/triacylglycerol synthase domain-containing protein n=1 Tax=Microbacterium sulfonylureivorans TaxID=2486854 RepID=UPI000FD82FA9|nr:wax ester/triacylglycerol synthase domain-containing protein [Microbacterium sulfonylureivorans]